MVALASNGMTSLLVEAFQPRHALFRRISAAPMYKRSAFRSVGSQCQRAAHISVLGGADHSAGQFVCANYQLRIIARISDLKNSLSFLTCQLNVTIDQVFVFVDTVRKKTPRCHVILQRVWVSSGPC